MDRMAGSGVLAAARNNAEWCDAMCRAHGMPGGFTESLFNPRKAPPYYPDAVTLTPDATVAEVLRLLDRRAVDGEPGGASVKDSFARLDLSAAGFRVLFEAQWILHLPSRRRSRDLPLAMPSDGRRSARRPICASGRRTSTEARTTGCFPPACWPIPQS
ncbi:hypothetical protein [Planotetraspora sp. GP83]|uniref:hypothetical protein n=1 Tax=Planotetraspora sp. GP83 TaxID=3156264 RepID=UPI003516D9E9